MANANDTTPPRRQAVVQTTWLGARRFETGRPGGIMVRIDGDGETGPTPPEALLSALATCTAVDVVDILAKRRTPVERLKIDVRGDRRESQPRRFLHLELRYEVDGAGIDIVQADRAIALALEKYCTVAASLAPDITVSAVAVVNGVSGRAMPLRIVN